MIDKIVNEQQMLSYIIHEPESLLKASGNYFLSTPGRALFEAIEKLAEQGLSFSEKHLLKEAHRICKDISRDWILKLLEVDYDSGKFNYYYTRLKKDYAKEQIQNKLFKETTMQVSSKDELDIEALQELITLMETNIALATGEDDITLSGKQMANAYRATLNARKSCKYKFTTGDSYLDKHLVTGASPKDMTCLFATTGMAKSAFALSLVNKQRNKRIPSLYISLELGTIATVDRIIASEQRIPISSLYPSELEKVDEEAFKKAEIALDKLDKDKYFAFIEEASLDMIGLRKAIQATKKKMGVDYLIVTIDLLTMMKEFSGGGATEYEHAMNLLHVIAKEENVHFILVVQANRATDGGNITSLEQIDKLRPKRMKDIKNSGAIAERCRLVISLFREKFYAESLFPGEEEVELMDDILKLTILKQNQGEVGNVLEYLFDGPTMNCYPLKLLSGRVKSESADSE